VARRLDAEVRIGETWGHTSVVARTVARARRAAESRRGGANAEDMAKGGRGEGDASRDGPGTRREGMSTARWPAITRPGEQRRSQEDVESHPPPLPHCYEHGGRKRSRRGRPGRPR
jgi:hypothetical protein